MDVPSQFHFRYRRLVEFADTDVAGIMHFSNYFRFVECAEHAFIRSLGFRVHSDNGGEHEGWPRLEVSCQYFKPARFEETLEVCLRIEEIRTTSMRYRFWIFAADAADRGPLATGAFSIVHVELDLKARGIRKTPIPLPLKQKLEKILQEVAERAEN
jgi:acyl-CoA thioester hydrolase